MLQILYNNMTLLKGQFCKISMSTRFWKVLIPAPSTQEITSGSGYVCSSRLCDVMLLHTWLPEAGRDTTSLDWGGDAGGRGGGHDSSSCLICFSGCGWALCCPHLTLSPDVSGISAETWATSSFHWNVVKVVSQNRLLIYHLWKRKHLQAYSLLERSDRRYFLHNNFHDSSVKHLRLGTAVALRLKI